MWYWPVLDHDWTWFCLMSYFYTKNVAFCCHPKFNSLAPKPGNFVPKAVEVMSVIDKFSVGFFLIEYTVSAWICYCMFIFTRYFNSHMFDVSLHTKACARVKSFKVVTTISIIYVKSSQGKFNKNLRRVGILEMTTIPWNGLTLNSERAASWARASQPERAHLQMFH